MYDDEDAAGCERRSGVLHDLPRLGQVEHDPVESRFVDALVAVADLDSVALERVRPEECLHVLLGPTSEVLTELVADDLGARPQQRERAERRSPTPDSSTLAPG